MQINMLDAHFVCCMMQKIYVNLCVQKVTLTRWCVACNFSDSRFQVDCGCRLKTDMGKCTWKRLNFKGLYTCTVLLFQPLWDNSSTSKCFFTSISKGWWTYPFFITMLRSHFYSHNLDQGDLFTPTMILLNITIQSAYSLHESKANCTSHDVEQMDLIDS